MATKFLEPGGDATFDVSSSNGFWGGATQGNPVISTDFVHGTHIKSIKCGPNVTQYLATNGATLSDTGTRISLYLYIVALPSATTTFLQLTTAAGQDTANIRITSTGVIQLWNSETVQIGSSGSTLSTGVWYRISLAYTITSTSINQFRLFKNGILDISVSNATLATISSDTLRFGNTSANLTFDVRTSDHYVDDSSSLTDTGDIWVTAKRPNANGTTNNFNVQIGAGGSGYGTGHSPQVNERALSTTNGWSVVAVAATTEEYNIEGKSVGDINIYGKTIVDYLGWVSAKSLLSETGSIIVNNISSNISLTSTITFFTATAGSTSYPAGTGTDIGIITTSLATTVSLYESGIVVAFINSVPNSGIIRQGFKNIIRPHAFSPGTAH